MSFYPERSLMQVSYLDNLAKRALAELGRISPCLELQNTAEDLYTPNRPFFTVNDDELCRTFKISLEMGSFRPTHQYVTAPFNKSTNSG